MTTDALALVIDVLGLDDFQTHIFGRALTQINRQGGTVNPIRASLAQHGTTDGALRGVVMLLLIDRQALGAPMTGRARLLPGTPRLLLPGARLAFPMPSCTGRLLFVPIRRPLLLAAFPARIRAFFLLCLPLPRGLAARGT